MKRRILQSLLDNVIYDNTIQSLYFKQINNELTDEMGYVIYFKYNNDVAIFGTWFMVISADFKIIFVPYNYLQIMGRKHTSISSSQKGVTLKQFLRNKKFCAIVRVTELIDKSIYEVFC